jgi:hypothetical protein
MEGGLDQGSGTHEAADGLLTEMAGALTEVAGDLCVAIEELRDATEVDEDGNVQLPEDMTLPFYEEDREIAFAIGLTVGAVLESKERAAKDSAEDEQTETAQTVESSVEQEQSVTVTA